MSLTPNYRFSIKKKRQVSTFESGVESITRRLSNSFANRRRSGRNGNTEANDSSISSFNMPKPKNMQGETSSDGLGGGSIGRGSGLSGNAHSSVNGAGSDSNNGYHNANASQYAGRSPVTQSNLNLGEFTQVTRNAVQHMLETHKMFKDLSDSYSKHAFEIEEVPKIQQKLTELEQQCKDKDERIRKQEAAIDTLEERRQGKEAEFERERKSVKTEREKLEADKSGLRKFKENTEKNFKIQDAQRRKEMEKELEKLKMEQENELEIRKDELEQETKRREKERKQALTTLEASIDKLSKELVEKKSQNEAQEEKLQEVQKSNDIIERAMTSYKEETEKLKARLEMIENEFALHRRTPEFYKKKFIDISRQIEAISLQYCSELNNDDFDATYKKLTDRDTRFNSVPISNSDDSKSLRIAHSQRVISSCLCETIWHSFSSERTSPHPDLRSLLCEISAELGKPGQSSSGRAANAWTALTMRALESLSSALTKPPNPSSQGTSSSPPPNRAEKFVDVVIFKLSPLLIPSQEPQVRKELYTLAESAIDVWRFAQSDELKITVDIRLDPAKRSEWNSLAFDPPLSPTGNGANNDNKFPTRPRVFTLFPRVTSQQLVTAADPAVSPPGSWPEPEQKPRTVETCIHHGIGLSESSALVVRGITEDEELKEFKRQGEAKIQEEMDAKRRNGRHGRSGSMIGSGPSSPTASWNRESTMKPGDD